MKKKLDLTTVIGLALAIGGIIVGYLLEGGSLGALLALSPILIIFGGTFGAVIITIPMSVLKAMPKILGTVFKENEYNTIETIDQLCEWAKVSQRQGIVALDELKKDVKDPYILNGLDLVASNVDPEKINEFMDNDMNMIEDRHKRNAAAFGQAGGFAPTMGIIGTVLGLIVVLGNMEGASMAALGGGIATAFLATFMGVASANLFFLPFEAKLKSKHGLEMAHCEIIKQGILAIQQQESPIIMRKRLLSMVPASMRVTPKKEA